MMSKTDQIKAMVGGGNKAFFSRYFDGCLWYKVVALDGGISSFEFPVPISDIGNATFHAEEKALLLMRYIRKHLDMLESAKKDPANETA